MNLQKELYEARTYHINLHVEYTQLKNAYERLVNVTEEEWRSVENLGLAEPVNKVISKFWEDIEFITTAFFDILELLNRKDYLETSILGIWRSQLVQFKDREPYQPEEVQPSPEDGITVVPGYLEYLHSQLVELKGRIKWVEYNLMKYKFAASHGAELKSIIDNVLKAYKKHSKWQIFSKPSSKHSKKLDEEVEWYRKRLKFFREDVQRIKSVQQAIFLKYVTPEDQKRFSSMTATLENALKGIPTNYPGSWIETSRLSMNPSVQCNPSHSSGALPLTNSLPGSVNQSGSVGTAEPVSGKSTNAEQPYVCPYFQNSKDKDVSHFESNNDASIAELRASINQESCSILMNRHSSVPTFERCQGDISQSQMERVISSQGLIYRERIETSEQTVCDHDRAKPESEVGKVSSNPFEDDDQIDGNTELNQFTSIIQAKINSPNKFPPETSSPQAGKDPNQQSTRSTSYESAEDSCSAEVAKAPPKTSSQAMPSTSRVSQYSSLVSGVYMPCTIPYAGPSSASDRCYPVPFPIVSYGVFPRTRKSDKNVLKKITSFLHFRQK